MSLWSHLCCLGYGLQARLSGLQHLLRGHRLRWRNQPDLWVGCMGDIVCYGCPDAGDIEPQIAQDLSHIDAEGSDLAIWCRSWGWIHWLAQRVCSWQGHRELAHPFRGVDETPILDRWYCKRCCADVVFGKLSS